MIVEPPSNGTSWNGLSMRTIGLCLLSVFTCSLAVRGQASVDLSSPSNGASNVSTQPTFTWSRAGGARSYDIQVAERSDMGGRVVDDNVSGTSFTPTSPLDGGQQYFWRVRGRGNGSPGKWSSIWNFTTHATAAGKVSLTSPSDGATGVAVSPTLRWQGSDGADTYSVQVSPNNGFTTLIVDRSGIENTSFFVSPALSLGTTYYWRVRGTGSSGDGPFSDVWSFSTVSSAPDQVSLLTPSDGQIDVSVTEILTWSSVDEAETYDLQVATDPDFSTSGTGMGKTTSLIIDETQIGETKFALPGVIYGETFYWRVRAVNSVSAGPWSEKQGFITQRGGSLQVQLLEPEQGAYEVSLSPYLLWKSVDGAASYHVQVGRNLSFSGGMVFEDIAQPDTTMQVFGLAPDTLYAWRVRADNAGSKNWSVTGSFATGASTRMAAPSLVAPADGSDGHSSEPLLEWTPIDGATDYKVEISASEPDEHGDFGSVVVVAVVEGSSFRPPSLPIHQTYYWTVEARGPEGSARSDVWSFTVASVTSSESDGLPGKFALHQNYPNPFGSNDAGTVVAYDIPDASSVTLSVFDIQGRHVVDLVNGWKPAGRHQTLWKAEDRAVGVYFLVLRAGAFVQSRPAYVSR